MFHISFFYDLGLLFLFIMTNCRSALVSKSAACACLAGNRTSKAGYALANPPVPVSLNP